MSDLMTTVDAHQHYWQLQNFPYAWHQQVNRPEMHRDYLPADILPEMQVAGIQYSVLIEADSSLAETTWMLKLAQRFPHIAGVVGWVDLSAPNVEDTLDQLAREPLFKGVRLITDEWQPLSHGLHALAEHSLTCDVLPREGMLMGVVEMMRAHPKTRFVVNHLAGQALIPGGVAPWTEQLRPLAELPNVFLKFSAIQGLAEPPPISVEALQPYLDSACSLFGVQRLLFASDWPVSTLHGPYAECIEVMRAATASLSRDEQVWIWGQSAIKTYGLTLRL